MRKEVAEAWMRIPVGIISGVILSVWAYLIVVLAVVNWFITLFTAKRNKDIAEFCEYWNTESYLFYKYMTFVSNERPFPFRDIKRLGKFQENATHTSKQSQDLDEQPASPAKHRRLHQSKKRK